MGAVMDRKSLPSELRGLLKASVGFPFAVTERTTLQSRLRKIRLLVALEIVLILVLFGIFVWVGMVPSLHSVPGMRFEGIGNPERIVVQLLFWIGVGFAAFCATLVWATSSPQGPCHPWRFALDARGMRIVTADGAVFEAPWADWRFVDYGRSRLHGYTVAILWIELACRGRTVVTDLRHVPRPRRLAAAILQNVLPTG